MERIVILEYCEQQGKFHYNYGDNRPNPDWKMVTPLTRPMTENTADDFCDMMQKLYFRKGIKVPYSTIRNDYQLYLEGKLTDKISTHTEKLYLIWAVGTTLFKVGVSKNVPQRLSMIQTGCPFKCELLYDFVSSINDARLDEKIILTEEKSRVTNGEWLRLDADSLDWILYKHYELRDSSKETRAEIVSRVFKPQMQ